ncbi:hypothetical protein Cadr_000025497 [Camelus dromedarius]|uniref:Uncharacterized protein n=1 Tax=Camelus dromedarius TaxID=9838 RepID=A0A5N4CMA1_CAMDR|nr:hypothetical protein Cadr_000025497 [Camelus dromedarius]
MRWVAKEATWWWGLGTNTMVGSVGRPPWEGARSCVEGCGDLGVRPWDCVGVVRAIVSEWLREQEAPLNPLALLPAEPPPQDCGRGVVRMLLRLRHCVSTPPRGKRMERLCRPRAAMRVLHPRRDTLPWACPQKPLFPEVSTLSRRAHLELTEATLASQTLLVRSRPAGLPLAPALEGRRRSTECTPRGPKSGSTKRGARPKTAAAAGSWSPNPRWPAPPTPAGEEGEGGPAKGKGCDGWGRVWKVRWLESKQESNWEGAVEREEAREAGLEGLAEAKAFGGCAPRQERSPRYPKGQRG